tara:strand:- start:386 stop:829 length:444 start_codon:yes stop_codon:yes gene_type:complete
MKVFAGYKLWSKYEPDRVWDSSIEFCKAHDGKFDKSFESEILGIAAKYGLFREVKMSPNGKAFELDGNLPSEDMFRDWLNERLDRYLWQPIIPDGFQKPCYRMTDFYCSSPRLFLEQVEPSDINYETLRPDFRASISEITHTTAKAA